MLFCVDSPKRTAPGVRRAGAFAATGAGKRVHSARVRGRLLGGETRSWLACRIAESGAGHGRQARPAGAASGCPCFPGQQGAGPVQPALRPKKLRPQNRQSKWNDENRRPGQYDHRDAHQHHAAPTHRDHDLAGAPKLWSPQKLTGSGEHAFHRFRNGPNRSAFSHRPGPSDPSRRSPSAIRSHSRA
jgi:hypothetical protein